MTSGTKQLLLHRRESKNHVSSVFDYLIGCKRNIYIYICYQDTIITNLYIPNNITKKYRKQRLTQVYRQNQEIPIIVGALKKAFSDANR